MSVFRVLLVILTINCFLVKCKGSLLLAGNVSAPLPETAECRAMEEELIDFVSVFSEVQSNSTIIICSSRVVLNLLISIEEVRNISIFGAGAIVECSANSSGFQLKNVSDFSISNLVFHNCSHQVVLSADDEYHLRASFSIIESCNVDIHEVSVIGSADSGLVMVNVEGQVDIINSTFENNGYKNRSGGNGLYIELSSYLPFGPQSCSSIFYVIQNCSFANNIANTMLDDKVSGFSRFDKGGGLCAFMRGVNNVLFKIQNSSFQNNTSYKYGGGIYLGYHGSASGSSIVIENSNLTRNQAKHGGGVYKGYIQVRQPAFATPYNCSFIYYNVYFELNKAEFGGGLSMYSTKTREQNNNNNVVFTDCEWTNNSGHFGSALAILPNAWNVYTTGYLPTLKFENIKLVNNKVEAKTLDGGNKNPVIRQYSEGAGAFYCSSHSIQFSGNNTFSDNSGSSFYLETGIVRFRKNSFATFSHNKGYRGGAILLIGSIMYLHDNTTVMFDSNRAYESGGAIYSTPMGIHMQYYSQTCFMDYSQDETVHQNVDDRNIKVFFKNNTVQQNGKGSGLGYSIFVSSLKACRRRHKFSINSTSQLNKTIGTFLFDPEEREMEISTEVDISKIGYSKDHPENLLLLSGKEETILYEDRDDLDQHAATTYLVSIVNDGDSKIILDEAYRYITTNKLVLYGKGGNTASVALSSRGMRRTEKWFKVKLKICPPGFVELQDNRHLAKIKCACSAGTLNQYKGIKNCDNREFKAILSIGFWAGYDNNKSEDENSLLTGQCPFRFCANINQLLLISSANKSELSDIICVNSRTGILCGYCKSELKPHFHSPQLECKSSEYCYLGWLLYLITEILPVTVVFLLILIFNVPFTSGYLNGFIFYCQVVELLPTVSSHHNRFSIISTILNKIHYLIYMTFNLKPLEMNELSYCIYSSESALDIIAFNYVTLAYSFILLLFLLLIIKKYKVSRLRIFRKFIPFLNFEHGTIHGLTAFLILCYANCVRTSFLLLLSVNLYTKEEKFVRSVVYHNGELEWMGTKHLNYAIPAITFLILACSLLPALLVIYPAHFRLLYALKFDKLSCTKVLIKPLDKLKPIFDSFQGCFKDNCRCFAGLYFIYRLLIIVIVLFFRFQEEFFLLQLLFVLMILLHAIFQPYKKSAHNTIDMLIFVNLVLIHAITFYNFNSEASATVTLLTGITRNVLILLPAIIMIVYIIIKKCSCQQKFGKLLCRKNTSSTPEEEFFEFETREYNESMYMTEYIKDH